MHAPLPYQGLIAIGEAHDKVMRIGQLGGPNDLLAAGLGARISDVLCNGGREKYRLLQHDRELIPKVVERVVAEVDVVQQDLATGDVMESSEKANQGSLTSTRPAGDSDPRTDGNVKGNILKDRVAGLVVEAHVPVLNGAASPQQPPRVRPINDIRCLIQQMKRPADAGEVTLQRGRLPSDGLQRSVKLSDVSHHQKQIAQTQRTSTNVAGANHKDSGRSQGHGQADKQSVAAFHPSQVKPRVHAFPSALQVALLLMIFSSKSLNDAECTQDLVDYGCCRAFQFPYVFPFGPQQRAIIHGKDEENR